VFQKIADEVNAHCQVCPQKDQCLKNQCVVYRVKNRLLGIYDPSKINIDDFFEAEDRRQISIFDFDGGDCK